MSIFRSHDRQGSAPQSPTKAEPVREGPIVAPAERDRPAPATAEPSEHARPGEVAAFRDSPAPGEQPPPAAAGRARWRGRAPRRRRNLGAAAVGTVGSGVLAVARLVMTVATLIALLIGLAIVLRDVDANAGNTIVKGIHEGANFFAGAFTGLITFKGHAKREITVDWGIALIVYLIVGALIARSISRIGRSGLRYESSRRAAG